jgi:spore germination cell wall hydrolase CwlJ-like protein
MMSRGGISSCPKTKRKRKRKEKKELFFSHHPPRKKESIRFALPAILLSAQNTKAPHELPSFQNDSVQCRAKPSLNPR